MVKTEADEVDDHRRYPDAVHRRKYPNSPFARQTLPHLRSRSESPEHSDRRAQTRALYPSLQTPFAPKCAIHWLTLHNRLAAHQAFRERVERETGLVRHNQELQVSQALDGFRFQLLKHVVLEENITNGISRLCAFLQPIENHRHI